jgi:hypothetical protein
MFPIKSNEPEKICLIFKNGGITPTKGAILMKIIAYHQIQHIKERFFPFFWPEERSQLRVYFFFFFFLGGNHIGPTVLEDWERPHSNGD